MVRAEYQWCARWIDTEGRDALPWSMARLLFQPNRAKGKLAAHCRATIARIRSGDLSGIEPIEGLPSWLDALSDSRKTIAEACRMLALGERTSYRLTRVLIALRLHHLAKGELPEDLEDLVPRYIESVPVDPYDGRPVRYSRESRRVYCVGDMTEQEWLLAPSLVQEDLGVAIEF